MDRWTSRSCKGKHWLRKMPMTIWRADPVPTELIALGKKFENRAFIYMCLIQLGASGKISLKKRNTLRKDLSG